MTDLTASLLVAAPILLDPNFARTVVLVCHHADDGAFGLILNRASGVPVVDHLPHWSPGLSDPATVFVGGPVQPETGIGLAVAPSGCDAAAWTAVTGEIGLIDLSADPEDFRGRIDLRVFSGYSGWGAGQLEGEIERGDWFVVDATEDDVLTADPGGLWRAVLRRQRGRLAMFADFPLDPRLN